MISVDYLRVNVQNVLRSPRLYDDVSFRRHAFSDGDLFGFRRNCCGLNGARACRIRSKRTFIRLLSIIFSGTLRARDRGFRAMDFRPLRKFASLLSGKIDGLQILKYVEYRSFCECIFNHLIFNNNTI